MFVVRLRGKNTLKMPYIFSICEVPEVLKLGKKNGQKRNLIYMTKKTFSFFLFLFLSCFSSLNLRSFRLSMPDETRSYLIVQKYM